MAALRRWLLVALVVFVMVALTVWIVQNLNYPSDDNCRPPDFGDLHGSANASSCLPPR